MSRFRPQQPQREHRQSAYQLVSTSLPVPPVRVDTGPLDGAQYYPLGRWKHYLQRNGEVSKTSKAFRGGHRKLVFHTIIESLSM